MGKESNQELDVLFPILCPPSLPKEDLSILGKHKVCFQAYDSASHLAVPTGALTKPKVYPVLMCKGRWDFERRPFFPPMMTSASLIFSQLSRIERASKRLFRALEASYLIPIIVFFKDNLPLFSSLLCKEKSAFHFC